MKPDPKTIPVPQDPRKDLTTKVDSLRKDLDKITKDLNLIVDKLVKLNKSI